jgi:protein-tyrosine phosphatase
MNDDTRHIALTGAYNIRDLGGYRTHKGVLTQPRRLLRADSPHRLSDDDIDQLTGAGLRTVIDLRASHERADAPTRLDDIAGIDCLHLPLFDALAPANISADAPAPGTDPLLGFYTRTLATRQAALREVFQAIAEAPPGAVMFHCTAGKDRTGLVAALALSVADVDEAEIVADYARTKALIADLVAEFLDLARERGTDLVAYRRVLDCRPDTMRAVLAHLQSRYGSAREYLTGIGLDRDGIDRLAARLLIPDRAA